MTEKINEYILFEVSYNVRGHEHGNTCVGGPDVSSPSCPLQNGPPSSVTLLYQSVFKEQCVSAVQHVNRHLFLFTFMFRHTQKPTYACMLIYLCFHHSCSYTHTYISLAVLSFTRSLVNTRALVSHHSIKPNIRPL